MEEKALSSAFFLEEKCIAVLIGGFVQNTEHKITSETTLKRLKFIIYLNLCVTSLHFLALNLR